MTRICTPLLLCLDDAPIRQPSTDALRADPDRSPQEDPWRRPVGPRKGEHPQSTPQWKEPAFPQAIDVRGASAVLYRKGQYARGPVAIVTRTAAIVGVTQMYAFFGVKIGLSIEVFWDLQEADRWLVEQAGAREDIGS